LLVAVSDRPEHRLLAQEGTSPARPVHSGLRSALPAPRRIGWPGGGSAGGRRVRGGVGAGCGTAEPARSDAYEDEARRGALLPGDRHRSGHPPRDGPQPAVAGAGAPAGDDESTPGGGVAPWEQAPISPSTRTHAAPARVHWPCSPSAT